LVLADSRPPLIDFAMIGFAQGWNVEMEVPMRSQSEADRRPLCRPLRLLRLINGDTLGLALV
jgi:hypothetical protein